MAVMIGLITSRAYPDPDRQHGDHLRRWLESNGLGRADVLELKALPERNLSAYPGLWWHHAGLELPDSALDPECLATLKEFTARGGKLFLSRGAGLVVEPLGVAAKPDIRIETPPRFFMRPGIRIEDVLHPLTRGLRRRLVLFNHLDIAQFSEAAWTSECSAAATPLGAPMMNGAVFRDRLDLLEWPLGKGRVVACGSAGLHIHDEEDFYRGNLVQFVASIMAYLEQPAAESIAPLPIEEKRRCATLARDRIVLEVDPGTGCASGLYAKDHPLALNFLADETNSMLDAADPPPWFGTVQGRYRSSGGTAWRDWTNRGPCTTLVERNEDRIRFRSLEPDGPLAVAWEYRALPDRMRWTFSLENGSDTDLEIGSLFIPLSLNTFFGLDAEQQVIYEKRVMMHNLICRRGSHVFAEPLSGTPPFLLILPRFDEGFECTWHDQGLLKGRQPAWEGLLYAGIHTAAEQERRGFAPWFHGHTALDLPAGGRKTFSFDLLFIDSYDGIGEALVREGLPSLDPRPSMVIPVNMPAQAMVRSALPFRIETSKGLRAVERTRAGEVARFDLFFDEPGDQVLKVLADRGESAYLFRAIPPIEDLIKARARFIAQNQVYRDPRAFRDHALLMWDAEEKALVVDPEHAFLAGGSDEACLADPVFLSAKQIFFPDEEEIEVLEAYIEHFLFGKVQRRDDFGVKRWVAEPGRTDRKTEGKDIGSWTDRSFNYPHVFNIYYSLFETAKRYDMTRLRTAREYLDMAARTALAYFEQGRCLNAAIEQGNVGDHGLIRILEALKAEGIDDLFQSLDQAMRAKVAHLVEHRYPYTSEYSFDTTGYEGVYWIRRHARDEAGVDRVLSTILATRGKQPCWYHHGGDVRWGWGNSKRIAPDEICFNYMCGLNARVLLDAFQHVRPDPRFLELGFAGSVAPWTLVEADGTAHDFFGWEPGGVCFDAWSSEMGLGIAASLFSLASIVRFDGETTPLGTGCRVEKKGDHVIIRPCDGLGRRLVMIGTGGRGVRISLDRARIAKAKLNVKTASLILDVDRVIEKTRAFTVRLLALHGEDDDARPSLTEHALAERTARIRIDLTGLVLGGT
jgi:hypothetical protein